MDHGDSNSVIGKDNDASYWKNIAEKYKEECVFTIIIDRTTFTFVRISF